jgi:FKBP-type peptidyl-prolyl cis-trans isomerase FkpA
MSFRPAFLPVFAVVLAFCLACSQETGAQGGESGSAAKPAAGSARTETGSGGLVIEHVKEGTGASPTATSRVKVHYHGTFEDGSVFDSSVQRGQPAVFPLNRVIKCWTEGLQKMKVGGKARLTCPPEIAYGAAGRPPKIPRNATLYFEVELIEVQ